MLVKLHVGEQESKLILKGFQINFNRKYLYVCNRYVSVDGVCVCVCGCECIVSTYLFVRLIGLDGYC